eukprot:2060463-Pyramimonas_sp.AAC.1
MRVELLLGSSLLKPSARIPSACSLAQSGEAQAERLPALASPQPPHGCGSLRLPPVRPTQVQEMGRSHLLPGSTPPSTNGKGAHASKMLARLSNQQRTKHQRSHGRVAGSPDRAGHTWSVAFGKPGYRRRR